MLKAPRNENHASTVTIAFYGANAPVSSAGIRAVNIWWCVGYIYTMGDCPISKKGNISIDKGEQSSRLSD